MASSEAQGGRRDAQPAGCLASPSIDAEMPTDIPVGALRKDALGVPQIVFFVVAAAAPLTAVVGVTPAAFMLGNGPGVPLTFLLVGFLYLLFSAGFTAMSGFVGSAGGFYSYIVAGLGPAAGVAGALLALATYSAIELGLCGLFGFFLNSMVMSYGGAAVDWWIYPMVLLAFVYACGRRSIEFSGVVLACCMIAEVTILLLMGVGILHMVTEGPAKPVLFTPFGPSTLMPGLGMSLVFVVTAFIGFEATAIFGEEARDRGRTIPRATYIAVVLIALFYAFTTWTIVLYYGPDRIQEQAEQHTATLYLAAVKALLGQLGRAHHEGLLVASLFACGLSFHNTLNRYLFAAGREGPAVARPRPDASRPSFAALCRRGADRGRAGRDRAVRARRRGSLRRRVLLDGHLLEPRNAGPAIAGVAGGHRVLLAQQPRR
jgi:amino acid transporter